MNVQVNEGKKEVFSDVLVKKIVQEALLPPSLNFSERMCTWDSCMNEKETGRLMLPVRCAPHI